tara:strand:- start:400 stop:831 length:432 start_codon:yes stop_codon:yes gene_type:complete
MAQVLAWCGARKPFHGVLALDECHRAKAAGNTSSGTAVLKLQAELPLARVVYASATAATELHNMQYLTRLGLWGGGTPGWSKWPSWRGRSWPPAARQAASRQAASGGLGLPFALVRRSTAYQTPPRGRNLAARGRPSRRFRRV